MLRFKKIYSTAIIFILIAEFCSAQNNIEAKNVIETFNNYKKYILNANGKKALNYVNCKTIRYYGKMLNHAMYADSATVSNLPVLDKFMVLSIRHRATKQQLLSFNCRKFFVFAINEGMIGKSSVRNGKIGAVSVKNDHAKGQFISDGKKTDIYLHFYQEDNRWKVDLTSVFGVSSKAFNQLIAYSNKPENVYLINLLEIVSGKKVESNIWQQKFKTNNK